MHTLHILAQWFEAHALRPLAIWILSLADGFDYSELLSAPQDSVAKPQR